MIKFLRLLLFPFAILYFAATEFRNLMFHSQIMRGAKFDRPVICVGNLSTGGTGKTPMTEYLIRLLIRHEIKPAVLSRGYGRKMPGFRMVTTSSTVQESGDEPLQIKQKFPEVDVAVCERRVDGIIELVKQNENIEVILLDDAFQHRAVKPSFSILTTSFFQPFFADAILPVGNLREMRRNASRASVIVVTKCPDWTAEGDLNFYRQSILKYSKAEVYFTQISYGKLQPVFGNVASEINLSENVLLVTGIAETESLVNHLKEKSKVKHLAFGDHHRFSQNDIDKIIDLFDSFAKEDKIIVTTEKDAKRLQSLSEEMVASLKKLPVFYLEIEAEFLRDKEKFEQLIIAHVSNFE